MDTEVEGKEVNGSEIAVDTEQLMEAAQEAISDKAGAGIAAATKPIKAASEGLRDSQSRHFDSFDKGTDFYTEALRLAETPEEREQVRAEQAEHQRQGHETATKNTTAWIHVAYIALAGAALFVGGPKLAAQVIKLKGG